MNYYIFYIIIYIPSICINIFIKWVSILLWLLLSNTCGIIWCQIYCPMSPVLSDVTHIIFVCHQRNSPASSVHLSDITSFVRCHVTSDVTCPIICSVINGLGVRYHHQPWSATSSIVLFCDVISLGYNVISLDVRNHHLSFRATSSSVVACDVIISLGSWRHQMVTSLSVVSVVVLLLVLEAPEASTRAAAGLDGQLLEEDPEGRLGRQSSNSAAGVGGLAAALARQPRQEGEGVATAGGQVITLVTARGGTRTRQLINSSDKSYTCNNLRHCPTSCQHFQKKKNKVLICLDIL